MPAQTEAKTASDDPRIADMLALIEQMADTARDIARGLFRAKGVEVQDKADATPVTEADLRIEAAWREMIAKRFPTHAIMGEEYAEQGGSADVTWVLDPIDGTGQFVVGMPLFGSLIGVMIDDQPVLGCIEMPIMGERWLGAPGLGTRLNGLRVSTRACGRLSQARMMSTTPAMFTPPRREPFARLSALCKDVRYGTDCYAYGLLAAGHCDLVAEASLKPVDMMALVPVLHHAGAVTSDWRGQAIGLDGDGTLLASGDPTLHAAALAALAP